LVKIDHIFNNSFENCTIYCNDTLCLFVYLGVITSFVSVSIISTVASIRHFSVDNISANVMISVIELPGIQIIIVDKANLKVPKHYSFFNVHLIGASFMKVNTRLKISMISRHILDAQ
jgi:hypothetical protein